MEPIEPEEAMEMAMEMAIEMEMERMKIKYLLTEE